NKLPPFSFVDLNGNEFSNIDLKKSYPVTFIYFNSECEYCQEKAKEIHSRKSEFVGTQLIFVSAEQKEAIQYFAQTYNLSGKPNIHFVRDVNNNFQNDFDANQVPFIDIYNQDNKLVKTFKGVVKIEKIINALVLLKDDH